MSVLPTKSAVRDFGSVVFFKETIEPFRIVGQAFLPVPFAGKDRQECLSYIA